jgi:hypothetical protein
MPGNNDQPGPRPRHAPHPAMWAAAAAAILLALAACASSTATVPRSSPKPSTLSFGSGGHTPTLTGAGSTFVAPFFATAFAKYHQQHPGVSIGYAVVGSGAGITAFSAKQVNFGASDVPMTAAEQSAAQGGSVTQVPVALGGEGVVYHLDLPAGARLHLTGPVLARIFVGQITHWNDPAITALNPGINLPGAAITVVHRSDGSGTTYIFSDYLSSVSPTWAAKVGKGKTLNWPVGEGAEATPASPPTSTAPRSPSDTSSRHIPAACSCPSPPSATKPETTSSPPPTPSLPPPPKSPTSPRPTSPSSTSPAPAATPSAATAGRWSTPTSPARPPGRNWSPCWTGSPTTARPTPPPTTTSHSHHRSGPSPRPCFSRSPAPTGHPCWANRDPYAELLGFGRAELADRGGTTEPTEIEISRAYSAGTDWDCRPPPGCSLSVTAHALIVRGRRGGTGC